MRASLTGKATRGPVGSCGVLYCAEIDAVLALGKAILDRIPAHVLACMRGETPR